MFRVFPLLALCALTGCAKAQLQHQSEAMNRAVGMSMSEQVFLNAVRASLDQPMSFTKLAKYTAAGMTNASFSPKFPFGPEAITSNDFGPTFKIDPGVSTIEYADANTAGAIANLNRSLDYGDLRRYLTEGIAPVTLVTLFISQFEIHVDLVAALAKQRKDRCLAPSARYAGACDEIAKIRASCPNVLWFDRLQDLPKEGKVPFDNRLDDQCTFLNFQSLLLTFRLSEVSIYDAQAPTSSGNGQQPQPGSNANTTKPTPASAPAQTPNKSGVKAATDQKNPTPATNSPPKIPAPTMTMGLAFGAPAVREANRLAVIKLKGAEAIVPTTRSPRSLLSYLGEIIAAENFIPEPFTPKVLISSHKVTLFHVIRGIPAEPPALVVHDSFGAEYYIPHPAYGSALRDQTLRIMAIAAELVNGAISQADFPPPASIVVRTLQ